MHIVGLCVLGVFLRCEKRSKRTTRRQRRPRRQTKEKGWRQPRLVVGRIWRWKWLQCPIQPACTTYRLGLTIAWQCRPSHCVGGVAAATMFQLLSPLPMASLPCLPTAVCVTFGPCHTQRISINLPSSRKLPSFSGILPHPGPGRSSPRLHWVMGTCTNLPNILERPATSGSPSTAGASC